MPPGDHTPAGSLLLAGRRTLRSVEAVEARVLRPGSVHANFCAAGVSLTAAWPGSRLSGGSRPVLAAFRIGEWRARGDSLAAALWESTRSSSSAKDALSSLPCSTTIPPRAVPSRPGSPELHETAKRGGSTGSYSRKKLVLESTPCHNSPHTHTPSRLPESLRAMCALLHQYSSRGRSTALRVGSFC